jgi:hypothetical protein
MDFAEILKSLSLDTWYKAIMWLGAGVLIASFFFPVRGDLTNTEVQLLSFGVFLIGLGEWKNHKVESLIKPPNAYTGGASLMSSTVRSPDSLGVLLDIVGVAVAILGIWKIVHPMH